MKASDYIARYLHAQGVTHVYEVIGGMITHLVDSIHRFGESETVSVHHEQAAAFAAEGYGRITGIPGVAMATSGPGATNLLTGIGSCHFDSTPGVFITGQVNRHEQKKDRAIRQLGFQETDIVNMARPVTKAAWLVESADELPDLLERAFRVALEGRPGPVLLDIPMDVQRDPVHADLPGRIEVEPAPYRDDATLEALLTALCKAQRPLILAGGGIRSARAVAEFRRAVEHLGVPVVNSLMAVDALPYAHPLRVGLIGSYGNRWANHALGTCDFILVLGSRLDVRQTGSETAEFKGERDIWHVDCEPGEINNRVVGCHPIVAHLRSFLKALADAAASSPLPSRQAWMAEIISQREQWPDTDELKDSPGINPNVIMHQLSRHARHASAYTVDVGQHQMWAAQSIELGDDQAYFTSGGMGSMGFSLPAAVGAAFGKPGRPVVVVAGDGAFQMNIQELQTVAHHKLPIKMVVLDNKCQGMVRQFQQSYFEERYASTYWGYSAPDFARVAAAYDIASRGVEDPLESEEAVRWLMESDKPALLHVKIDTFANAYPKIAFGYPITEMEPFVKPIAMEST